MTITGNNDGRKTSVLGIGAFWATFRSLLLILVALATSLFFSDEIAHSVKSGLSLSASVIIPSVFPFMIIADLMCVCIDFSSLKSFGYLFEKTFKINRAAISAFLLGILCGFPLGVKRAVDLYRDGKISKDEAERLIGFCNNTGPAFLVSGIGLGLRSDPQEGLYLYLGMVASAVIVGFIFSIGKTYSRSSYTAKEREAFSLTLSIKNAGINTLNICSYLTFFACLCGLLRKLLGQTLPYLLILPFLEIGNATSILSKTQLLSAHESLALSAFAVGFSGFSVHMQALSFIEGSGLKTGKYFIMKLLQGIISVGCVILLELLFL